eukprot:9498764-Pyramimonas_sp.AAC.1
MIKAKVGWNIRSKGQHRAPLVIDASEYELILETRRDTRLGRALHSTSDTCMGFPDSGHLPASMAVAA